MAGTVTSAHAATGRWVVVLDGGLGEYKLKPANMAATAAPQVLVRGTHRGGEYAPATAPDVSGLRKDGLYEATAKRPASKRVALAATHAPEQQAAGGNGGGGAPLEQAYCGCILKGGGGPRPAKLQRVRKHGANHARLFWCCSVPAARGCGFFGWADTK